jgi:hypothetical protein
MTPQMTSIDKSRMEMLGNSVVPDAVRKAFVILASAFQNDDMCTASVAITPANKTVGIGHACGPNTDWPKCGIISKSELHLESIRVKRPNIRLVFEGGYPEPDVKGPRTKHPSIQTLTLKSGWMSPRRSCVYPSRVLTIRSIHDLGTMLAFEKQTPSEQRNWRVNPRFVEWMMGYPEDYTLAFETHEPI